MCFISTRDFLGLPDAVMVSGYGKPSFIASCRFAGNHPEAKCGPCGVMLTCSLCFWSICRNTGMLNDIHNNDMYMYLVVSNDHDGNLMLCFSMLFWLRKLPGASNRWFLQSHCMICKRTWTLMLLGDQLHGSLHPYLPERFFSQEIVWNMCGTSP